MSEKIAVGVTLNADEAGRRELVIELGGGAMVLGPDLVDVIENVLTGEEPVQHQLSQAQQGLLPGV